MEGVGRNKVKLVPFKKEWGMEFLDVKKEIISIWGNNVIDIQHIGSTAINGMCAKPILDVAVVLNSFNNMDIASMEQIGYEWRGFQTEIKDRCLFVMRSSDDLSLRHIHCYEPNNLDFAQCLWFRDYLNIHSDASKEYAELKQKLYSRYKNDRKAYSAGKEDFITKIYERMKV